MSESPHGKAEAKQSPAESNPVVNVLKRARRNPFRLGVIIGSLVTIGVVLLVVQNGESAQIDWLIFHFRAQLWIILILTAAAGAVAWELTKVAIRHGRRVARERKVALSAARNVAK